MTDIRTDPNAGDLVREIEAVLGRRVDELERHNRQLKRNASLMVGAVAVMLLLTTGMLISIQMSAGGVAEVVEANRFVLRDTEGHVRGVMGLNADGSSRFVLQDRDGRERLRLNLLADGSPGMAFTDREGKSRVVMGLLSDETATLVFADRWGQTRAVLGLAADESSTLVFANRSGESRVGIGVESDEAAGVTLFERGPTGAEEVPPAAEEPGAEAEPEGN
jgi:hypothetical protein